MKAKDFEVLKVKDAESVLSAENKDFMSFDFQHKFNNAYVFILASGDVLMLPNSLQPNENGIKFKSKKNYEVFSQKDRFPINNTFLSIQEIHQKEILRLGENTSEVVNFFKERLKIVNDAKDYKEILQKIKSIDLSDDLTKGYIYSRILLGEQIRITVKGKWILLKEYGTFNPYYTPAIIDNKNQIIELIHLSDLFFDNPSITVDNFLKLPFIFEASLKFNSSHFTERYSGYIIK